MRPIPDTDIAADRALYRLASDGVRAVSERLLTVAGSAASKSGAKLDNTVDLPSTWRRRSSRPAGSRSSPWIKDHAHYRGVVKSRGLELPEPASADGISER